MELSPISAGQTQSFARVVDASLEHIFIAPGHAYWGKRDSERQQNEILDVARVACVAGKGLVGDRYFGGKPNKAGQVTFFEADVFERVREAFHLPELPVSIFRRNVIVRGVRLVDLLNQRFTFQGITFEGAQECRPCVWMDRMIAPGAQAFLKDEFRGGLRCRILTDGELRKSTPRA